MVLFQNHNMWLLTKINADFTGSKIEVNFFPGRLSTFSGLGSACVEFFKDPEHPAISTYPMKGKIISNSEIPIFLLLQSCRIEVKSANITSIYHEITMFGSFFMVKHGYPLII